jgi:NADH:ubiquinone oxidoreductase subunit D
MGFTESQPYEIYDELNFDVLAGTTGDCYDRYLIRLFEMKQSILIIEQCLDNIPFGPIKSSDNKVPPSRFDIKQSMEF